MQQLSKTSLSSNTMHLQGHSQIVGIGGYVPSQRVTSQELLEEIGSERRFGIAHDWLDTVCGIEERRIAPVDSLPSDLALEAAKVALEDAGLVGRDMDLIIFCGIEGDWSEPATAHRIQTELDSKAICLDVSNACHGFMNGLTIADLHIAAGAAEHVLVVTGEIPSRISFDVLQMLQENEDLDILKKKIGVLTVGDAGGAVVLKKNKVT
ncbi:3-oxoacyl-ACP synthase III family protein [Motiliproteus sp. MSK22-1]|uniref:3-oxoacyl-ACP synthase III family protein n=1 Tax=Motiliproteus sp. MSK22-1 TaxID=1897630 RepID=UPI0018E9DDA5|nr:hypothetical protein [Motiliproteus sp. MSK22-1]